MKYFANAAYSLLKSSLFSCGIAVCAIAAGSAFTSCSSKSENADARGLLTKATEAIEANDAETALALLDSLQKTYPSEIAIQREAIVLRPKAIEIQATAKLVMLDSLKQADLNMHNSAKATLKWIKTPGMIEGFWTPAATYNASFFNSTGIQPRVDEIGQFYIVSSANPALKHTSVALVTPKGEAATQAVAYDGESNYRIDGGEVITFSPAQSDTIGHMASLIRQSGDYGNVKIQFRGGRLKNLALSRQQIDGLANAWEYSHAIIRARDNEVERERLTRIIEIARRQAAAEAAREN